MIQSEHVDSRASAHEIANTVEHFRCNFGAAHCGGALHPCRCAPAMRQGTTCRTRSLVPLTHLTTRATALVVFRPPRCPRGPAPALACQPAVLCGEGVARGAAAEGCLGSVPRGHCGCRAARRQSRLCPIGRIYQVGRVPPPPRSRHATTAEAEGGMGFDAQNSRQPAALPASSPRVLAFNESCKWGCPRDMSAAACFGSCVVPAEGAQAGLKLNVAAARRVAQTTAWVPAKQPTPTGVSSLFQTHEK